jgi:hypothetical protein
MLRLNPLNPTPWVFAAATGALGYFALRHGLALLISTSGLHSTSEMAAVEAVDHRGGLWLQAGADAIWFGVALILVLLLLLNDRLKRRQVRGFPMD